MRQIYDIISPGIIQFLLAVFLILLIFADKTLGLPSFVDMAEGMKTLFDKYGFIVLTIMAFVESLFMLGLYFPGSYVIILSVIMSDKSLVSLSQIGFYCWIGFVAANCLNYFLGRYGYYKVLLLLGKEKTISQMQNWLSQHQFKTIFFSAIHPNFLSVTVVCCGISRILFLKTIIVSSLALAVWIIIWIITTTPFLKSISIDDPNQGIYLVCFFFLWGVINIILQQMKNTRAVTINKRP